MDSVYCVSLLLDFLIIGTTLANALVCYNTGNFTTNSTYTKNQGLLLSYLASNITANGGFYTATVGHDPDKVYGLALCRSDFSSEACSSCVNSGIQTMLKECPNQIEAITWGGGQSTPCIIHYSNRSIYGRMELRPFSSGYNINNITSNMEQFSKIWRDLMELVLTRASMGSSEVKSATGEAELIGFQRIYVMMQCTPDISQSNCSYCLRESVSDYNGCCHGKQGGYVLKPSCWFRWDLYPFYNSLSDDAPAQSLPPPNISPASANTSMKEKRGIFSPTVAIIVVPAIIFMGLVALTCTILHHRKQKQEVKIMEDDSSTESLQFNFGTIRIATNNFSDDNKLGQGGFGAVFKGVLPGGKVIAVKRMSRTSRQGEVEFKNEVVLVARLRHRNLVRLLGFCLEGKEKLLIYEFLPNSSLDHFIFDRNNRSMLDWEMRYKIIVGIARGILYLHEDSQLRIIHRDLKASNILLDEDMNSKISDFGIAKLFEMDQTQDCTTRIVGTFGYMAPEYAMHGRFSIKSDVFSFGVLVLEIISGKRNNSFSNGEEEELLLTYAWKGWNEGTASNLIDPILKRNAWTSDILRCIHIGLLCVQENVANRPTMASVVLMLSSSSHFLPLPSRPAYFMHSFTGQPTQSPIHHSPRLNQTAQSENSSVNETTISDVVPR